MKFIGASIILLLLIFGVYVAMNKDVNVLNQTQDSHVVSLSNFKSEIENTSGLQPEVRKDLQDIAQIIETATAEISESNENEIKDDFDSEDVSPDQGTQQILKKLYAKAGMDYEVEQQKIQKALSQESQDEEYQKFKKTVEEFKKELSNE